MYTWKKVIDAFVTFFLVAISLGVLNTLVLGVNPTTGKALEPFRGSGLLLVQISLAYVCVLALVLSIVPVILAVSRRFRRGILRLARLGLLVEVAKLVGLCLYVLAVIGAGPVLLWASAEFLLLAALYGVTVLQHRQQQREDQDLRLGL